MKPKSFIYGNLMVATYTENDQFWFVAHDVAVVLGYSDAEAMTRKLDFDEKRVFRRGSQDLLEVGLESSGSNDSSLGFTPGKTGTLLINESGLYSAILTSRKPAAKQFKKWVTSEVLPALRKHGTYTALPYVPKAVTKAQRLEIDDLSTIVKLFDAINTTQTEHTTQIKALEAQVKARPIGPTLNRQARVAFIQQTLKQAPLDLDDFIESTGLDRKRVQRDIHALRSTEDIRTTTFDGHVVYTLHLKESYHPDNAQAEEILH